MTSLWFEKAFLATGWADGVRLSIEGGRVAAIVTACAAEAGDERHALAIPGLPNLHSHAFQRAMAGLAEKPGPGQDSFWTWREVMYRFTGRIGPDELRAIAALAYMEMLETGFTTVGEFHYLHHDLAGAAFADPAEMAAAICAAAGETGIGLTLLPVFYAHAGFGGQPPSPAQARFINDLDGFAGLLASAGRHVAALDGARIGVAPHSLRAVTADELQHLVPMAAGGPIHIHIAEQVREVDDCLAATGQRPVEWLLDHAPVGPQWCLVHATHMAPRETMRLAQSGAVAGLCPITEANLGDGLFPAPDFLAAGGRFGVGSDSNVLIGAAEELRWLEYAQRLGRMGRNLFAGEGRSSGTSLFSGALSGGAQALGGSGGIAEGQSADLVSLDPDHAALAGQKVEDVLDAYIFAAGRSPIDCVWRRGRKCVTGGRHKDRDAIAGTYRRILERLIA